MHILRPRAGAEKTARREVPSRSTARGQAVREEKDEVTGLQSG